MIIAFIHLLSNTWSNTFTRKRKHLRLSHKCDLTKALMIMATLIILNKTTDASKMYHSVRGQETIKLYVIFNVLEVSFFLSFLSSIWFTNTDSILLDATTDRRSIMLFFRSRFTRFFILSTNFRKKNRW